MKPIKFKSEIHEIKQLTSDAKLFKFTIPEGFSFEPGQYVSMILDKEGERIRRPYSIASVPNKDYFELCIKIMPESISSKVVDSLKVGDKVMCVLNWDSRYELIRMHTAAHLLSAIFHDELGALITGNQKAVERSRMDFSLENFDRDKIIELINKSNEIIKQDIPVKVHTLKKEEALKIPGIIKLANKMPPNLDELRIVQIGEVDTQADGGTHVKSSKEIGEIVFLKAENKGKNNRRIYFRLKD